MEVELSCVEIVKYQEYNFVETSNIKFCPFCKSDAVFNSSTWSNEECLFCGATYIIDGWWKDT